ncbi:hypothetical protein GY45DRAFT_1326876 [Cubamyces sp. BRFM 1775]|nr:hypothetical protein GY45DRAFT_1326876 [Cubamyces sp. BRFM 1775]
MSIYHPQPTRTPPTAGPPLHPLRSAADRSHSASTSQFEFSLLDLPPRDQRDIPTCSQSLLPPADPTRA